MEFGRTLTELREIAGVSRAELANLAGGNEEHIGKVENGTRNPPRRKRLLAWAKALAYAATERKNQPLQVVISLVGKLFNEAGYAFRADDLQYLSLFTESEDLSHKGLVYTSPGISKLVGKTTEAALLGRAKSLITQLEEVFDNEDIRLSDRTGIAIDVLGVTSQWLKRRAQVERVGDGKSNSK